MHFLLFLSIETNNIILSLNYCKVQYCSATRHWTYFFFHSLSQQVSSKFHKFRFSMYKGTRHCESCSGVLMHFFTLNTSYSAKLCYRISFCCRPNAKHVAAAILHFIYIHFYIRNLKLSFKISSFARLRVLWSRLPYCGWLLRLAKTCRVTYWPLLEIFIFCWRLWQYFRRSGKLFKGKFKSFCLFKIQIYGWDF